MGGCAKDTLDISFLTSRGCYCCLKMVSHFADYTEISPIVSVRKLQEAILTASLDFAR